MKNYIEFEILGAKTILERAGYLPHYLGEKYGFVRVVGKNGSKYHAKVKKNIVNLHFDKQRQGLHSATYKSHLSGEAKRIKKISL